MGGIVSLFGRAHDEDEFMFNWTKMISKVPTIYVPASGPLGFTANGVRTVCDLVAQGRLDLSYLLTHRLSWRDVARAYDIYSGKKENSLKIVMTVN